MEFINNQVAEIDRLKRHLTKNSHIVQSPPSEGLPKFSVNKSRSSRSK